jgi:hypothetical protein
VAEVQREQQVLQEFRAGPRQLRVRAQCSPGLLQQEEQLRLEAQLLVPVRRLESEVVPWQALPDLEQRQPVKLRPRDGLSNERLVWADALAAPLRLEDAQ